MENRHSLGFPDRLVMPATEAYVDPKVIWRERHFPSFKWDFKVSPAKLARMENREKMQSMQ
jgi:hypothetical protein